MELGGRWFCSLPEAKNKLLGIVCVHWEGGEQSNAQYSPSASGAANKELRGAWGAERCG